MSAARTVVKSFLLGASLVFGPVAACGGDEVSGSPAPGPASSDDAGSTPGADVGSAPTDAGTKPPPGDATGEAAVDPCAGRTICDSFESAAVGGPPGAPWKLTLNGGTAVVSTARAFTGSRSLKLETTAATYQRAMITAEGAPLFPLAQNVLYGRMMVWLENAAGNNVHWNMITGAGPVPGHPNVFGTYNYGGQLGTYLANYDTRNANTDCWKHSKSSMPIGRWACFAWKLDGPNNAMRLSTEAGELADMHVLNKGEGCLGHDLGDVWIAPAFTTMRVGWESVQTDPGHVMYIDDVIFDDTPVSCP